MDLLMEFLLELYMELMFLIVPEKNVGKGHRVVAALLAFVVILGLFALVLWGVWLIADRGNLWGILPIVAAGVLSLAQIVAGMVLYNRHH